MATELSDNLKQLIREQKEDALRDRRASDEVKPLTEEDLVRFEKFGASAESAKLLVATIRFFREENARLRDAASNFGARVFERWPSYENETGTDFAEGRDRLTALLKEEKMKKTQQFWGDPNGNIHRMEGEQEIVATVTPACTDEEWKALCAAGPAPKENER